VKLLIDQDLAHRTASLLRERGHDAVNAREVEMSRAPDPLLIAFAIEHGRIIATLDSDYHRIIATEGLQQPSVILIREPSPTAKIASDLIHHVCQLFEHELQIGCLLTCTRKSVRLRHLPVR
jgi:predicted nuclease of predicted toxin-antitoxin system